MNAKNRFCRMFRIVARDRARARAMPRRSPLTSVTAALSIATSVPVPMAMPTWACASHRHDSALRLNLLDLLDLLLGQYLGHHVVDAEFPGHRRRRRRIVPRE